MPAAWPKLDYGAWSATRDTLHAHTQVLGKLAATLAPPEPQLQHAALRLTARGWETLPLPAPDGSGAIVVALDLRRHEAIVEHSDGREAGTALAPDRPVGVVTRAVLNAVRQIARPAEIDPTPQEVARTVPRPDDRRLRHAQRDERVAGGRGPGGLRPALSGAGPFSDSAPGDRWGGGRDA